MRGYPNGPLIKRDYENLLTMPEYEKRAKADLAKLAAIDDSKITIDQGTEKSPKLIGINNPMPVWKRAGFRDMDELLKLAQDLERRESRPSRARGLKQMADGSFLGDASGRALHGRVD